MEWYGMPKNGEKVGTRPLGYKKKAMSNGSMYEQA